MSLRKPRKGRSRAHLGRGILFALLFALRPDTKPAILAVSRSTEAYWRKEVMLMFVPTAKKDAGGRVNPIWTSCRHCRQQVNVAGVSDPWRCPFCGKRSDEK